MAGDSSRVLQHVAVNKHKITDKKHSWYYKNIVCTLTPKKSNVNVDISLPTQQYKYILHILIHWMRWNCKKNIIYMNMFVFIDIKQITDYTINVYLFETGNTISRFSRKNGLASRRLLSPSLEKTNILSHTLLTQPN